MRPKGSPNKYSAELKQAFLKAFHFAQLDDRSKLDNWAAANPDKFYPLIARLLPTEIEMDITKTTFNINISGYEQPMIEQNGRAELPIAPETIEGVYQHSD